MKRSVVCAAILGISTIAIGQGVEQSIALVKGQTYKQTLDAKTVSSQPSWNPLKEKCPLELSRAVQLASERLTMDIPNSSNMKLFMVNLNRVPDMENKWHYTVHFGVNCETGDFASVFVNLDGTVPAFVKQKKE